ncbi:MAG: adenylosuccinate lyase [Candidatus Omnitrophica bacterium]|nr:adenylosuccinate lyase [Candidatus Omnitrophota bacterium]MDD5488176.1 adenylosuccinate lyase [Candidatus Omnitrophota bacterium]
MIERYSRPEMSKIWTDENKFQKMLDVEILACEAFAELGFVPKDAVEVIKEKAGFDVDRINEIEKKTNHDVVAFIKNLSENIGGEAKYLHFGLTSSDVLDTGLSIMMCEAMDLLIEGAEKLRTALRNRAIEHKYTPMMGRSHGVHAEPTSFGLKMALFYKEVERDIVRMKSARDIIAYGKISGSVGTFANVEPFVEEYICERLGLRPARVSSQILQRDRHAEYLTTIAIVGATLEKIALEVRGLQKTEIGEVQEYFAKGQTGSSSMPHKKNPIICERITGLARVLRGNALAAIENVALWHERDISHSSVERIIVPDSTILLDYMLDKTTMLVEKLVVNKEKMLENIGQTKGMIFSQRLMLELIKRGATRMEAYDFVQALALRSYETGKGFKELAVGSKDFQKYMTKEEISDCFELDYHLQHVDHVFKKAGIEG